MIRARSKASVVIGTSAIAGLLAVASGPSTAADDGSRIISPGTVESGTCAKPDYPKADLRAGHEGVATVLFLVAPDGAVRESKIARSSGYASLDEAARSALAKCRFTPAGDADGAARWYPVSYVWTLEGSNGEGITSMSPANREQAFLWTARVLARYRYKSAVQAPDVTPPVLDRYLEALDAERLLFTRSDIAKLAPQREQLARNDDSRQLDAAFALFEQMRARKTAMLAWTRQAIPGATSAPDGNGPAPRPADASWPASDDDRQALWRRHLADEVRSLRSAGAGDGAGDKDIVAILTRRNDTRLARLRALTVQDAFESFMNAYVGAYDPHGSYASPLGRVRTRVGEPGHVGVGIVLKKQGEWITVHDLAGDGSAGRSGQLQPGDRIVAVAQGAGQPATDVVGWSVDDVVALLQGVPGSTVVLQVSRGAHGDRTDKAPRTVALVRSPVPRGDAGRAAARVEVLDRGAGSQRIAVVTIPAFYVDSLVRSAGIGDYTSMTRDVAGLLATVKAQQADAVLLDMRGNGGGSLTEAIGLAGLFLPHAPVAQQRDWDGKIKVESTPDSAPAWDGPLAVLIDGGSAAATEIVAAAIQDHGRGLVIGERSIGRTSVQTVVSLDRFAPSPSVRYGDLRMTVAQVYRVSGATFEQAGVVPDIGIPGVSDAGVAANQLAFPAVPIGSTDYRARSDVKALLPSLSRRHAARVAKGGTPPPGGEAAIAEIRKVQLDEALQVVADQVELWRTAPTAGR